MTDFSNVAAVIVTRNRVSMLRETLRSIQQSTYPIGEIIVSDDGTDDATATMLKEEFPQVLRIDGPRRGISANRNRGIKIAQSPYILLSDDDMIVDSRFVELAMKQILNGDAEMVFTATCDYEEVIFPNALDFLGFASKPYTPGAPYDTANQQCFVITRKLALDIPYDEVIASYGYEEMDYAYRVRAAGHSIGCVESCKNIHLAPNAGQLFRFEQDGCRLYVTYKRHAYVDRRPCRAALFLLIAVPHHLFASIWQVGLKKGLLQASSNFRSAFRMLSKFRRQDLQS